MHRYVTCDMSGEQPLTGTRYHKMGANYYVNETEFAKLPDAEKQHYEIILFPGAPRIAYEPVIHYGVVCDGTNVGPIIGTRFHKIGEDYDLSQAEFAKLDEEGKQAFELIVHPRSAAVPYERPAPPTEEVPDFVRLIQSAMTMLPGGDVDIDLSSLIKNLQGGGGGGKCGGKPCGQAGGRRCGLGAGASGCPRGGRGQRGGCCKVERKEVSAGTDLPTGTFGIGSYGAGVEQLQRFLVANELMDASAIAWRAGMYGPWTRKTISVFQRTHGIADFGRYDDNTRTALLAYVAAMSGTAPETKQQEPEKQEPEKAAAPADAPTDPEPAEDTAPTAPPADGSARWAAELQKLNQMGFLDNELLANLLDQYGSVPDTLSQLLR